MSVSAELRFEIQDLYDRYVTTLDDGPLEDWPELFTDTCLYRIIARENYDQGLPLSLMYCESRGMLKDRVVAVQETMMHEARYLRHMVSTIRVRPNKENGEGYAVMANYCVLETLEGDFTRVLNSGRYLDHVVREDDGELRFAEKSCVYDSEMVPNSIIYPI